VDEFEPCTFEGLRLLRAVDVSCRVGLVLQRVVRVSTFAGLLGLAVYGVRGWAQEVDRPGGVGGVRSFGISTSYSPDSSHILIGEADQRRTWTLGVEYTHLLHLNPHYRLDFEGSLTPFYLESDPDVTASIYTTGGRSYITQQTPVRVLSINHQPLGVVLTGGGKSVPLYAIYGRENTYAASLAPVGVRVSALPRWTVQPSFAIDLGFVVSAHDIPVDLSDQFNYLFAFGPGVQIFTNPRASLRLEYIYRHISNAHQGYQNPGVDQGVFRLTLSRRR